MQPRNVHATASTSSKTCVSVVIPLAMTDAIALKWNRLWTRSRTASLTRIVVPYSLFNPSRRAARFTLLPNTVNLAARLEGLNKEYGTTILVSEAVRNRVENCFRFKAIASVIAKGMTTETRVYELVEAVA